MKMCVLPNTDKEPSLAAHHGDDGTIEASSAKKKPRCTSFDYSQHTSSSYTQKGRSQSDPSSSSSYHEEKRTNSDDESINKESIHKEEIHSSSSCNNERDQSVAAALEDVIVSPTNRLDALAAMASEAKRCIVHEDEEDHEEIHLQCNLAVVAHSRHSESINETSATEETAYNCSSAREAVQAKVTSSSGRPPIHAKRPRQHTVTNTQPSHPLPLPGLHSPPYDRYPPSMHFMHPPPPPGYGPFPHPSYPCYVPSPHRAVIHPSYYHPYYPPPHQPHVHPMPTAAAAVSYNGSMVSTLRGQYHAYTRQFERQSSKVDSSTNSAVPAVPSKEEDKSNAPSKEADKSNAATKEVTCTTRRPSKEGLPLKKRKFVEVAAAVETDLCKTDESAAAAEAAADSRHDEKSLKIDLCNDNNDSNDNVEDESDKAQGDNHVKSDKSNESSSSSNQCPQKIQRIASSSDKVVTPSPRNIESRNGSSSSVKTTADDKTNNEQDKCCKTNDSVKSQDNCVTKKKSTGLKSPSPPAVVHPSCLSNNTSYPHGFPPIHRPQGHTRPHHPSPLRAAQQSSSNLHRPHHEVGLLSPPKHPFSYPRMSHPHPYPPYHSYYPPHGAHEVGPYWHPHPHYMPAAISHRPPQPIGGPVGSSGLNHKPMEVASSSSIEINAKASTSPCNKEVENTSTKCSESPPAAVGNNAEDSATDPNSKRCVHVYGPMLVHYLGIRNSRENEAAPLPSFYKLVNYPEFLPQRSNNLHENVDGDTLTYEEAKHRVIPTTKNCVMCGTSCTFVGNGSKTKEQAVQSSASPYIIPKQNKGLCTSCDVKVWLVRDRNQTIKWCKGCKNFRTWSAFGEKSRATKCSKCRDRQREKYAAQKEEMKRKKKESVKDKECSASDGEKSSKASDDEMEAASGLCRMTNGDT